jgi:hypothetical protein
LNEKAQLLVKEEEKKVNAEKERLRKSLSDSSHRALQERLRVEERALRHRLNQEFAKKMHDYIEQQRLVSKRQFDINKKQNYKKIVELHEELRKKEAEVGEMRRNIQERLDLEKKTLQLNFFNMEKVFKRDSQEAENKKMKKLSERLHRKLERELRNREEVMRAKLQSEFSLKAQQNLLKQKAEVAKRKALLESEIQRKVGQMLK